MLLSLSTSLYAEILDLDLKTARKITLENNPSIKLAREGVNRSSQQIIESRAGLLPFIQNSDYYNFGYGLILSIFVFAGFSPLAIELIFPVLLSVLVDKLMLTILGEDSLAWRSFCSVFDNNNSL